MKFVCERCHTKYSIADEKVRGKVLKVRCKSCENVITVRESGATIDDLGSGVSKEAPIARSGTLDGRAESATVSAGGAARRGSAETGRRAAPGIPASALQDPHGPAAAPPHRRPTPRPMPSLSVDDGVEWYLAVDGAQTGPFRRPILIDKILAVPPGGDIHIWNANLGAWKPPKDVADVSADLARRRRPSAMSSTGNVRRPSGAMPIIAPRPVPTEISEGHSGSNGVSAFNESADTQISAGPPLPWKRNGVAPAAAAAQAAPAHARFGLDDMFGDDAGDPAAAAAVGAAAPAAAASSVSVPLAGPAAAVAPRAGGRPVRLIFGAVALAVIVCGIVAVVMLRKPAPPVAATPPAASAGETNFANLAEKLANEQAAEKPAEPPPTAPVVEETKPVVAKVDAPVKGGKGKGKTHGKNGGSATVSPTSPPPMTEEQLRAAARFGDTSTREVRASSGGAASAHSMPAQADISRVINNNRQGIQTCYQRALLRDSTLTQGKVTVRVSIGISGKVKSVNLDAPSQFRSMESCVRDVMSRWAFPPSSEEYGTEFPVVLQGNQ